jgi:hypothetical protein
VTVLQNKSSREHIAKVEKLIESTCEQLTLEHAERRRHDTTGLLVVLKAYYTCSVDMCSQNRKAVFLLEYFPQTLSQEIERRASSNTFFPPDELTHLFSSVVQALKLQRQYLPPIQ